LQCPPRALDLFDLVAHPHVRPANRRRTFAFELLTEELVDGAGAGRAAVPPSQGERAPPSHQKFPAFGSFCVASLVSSITSCIAAGVAVIVCAGAGFCGTVAGIDFMTVGGAAGRVPAFGFAEDEGFTRYRYAA
jgi:hypothetical protein